MTKANVPNLLVLILGHMTLGSTGAMMILLNGFVGAQLSPTPGLATLGMGMLVAGTALSVIPAARLAARKGRRFGFFVGAACCISGCALCALSLRLHSFSLYCWGMMLLGSTLAFVQQFRFAAAENVPAARMSMAVSLILLGGLGAAMIGPSLGVNSIGWIDSYDYMGSYFALSGLALVFAFSLLFYRSPKPERGKETLQTIPFTRLWNGRFFLGVVCGATSYSVMSMVMTATPMSMQAQPGLTLADAATVIQWHIVAMFIPSLFTGLLIQKLGENWVILLGLIAFIASICLALSGFSYHHYFGALILLGVGWNALFVSGTHIVVTSFQDQTRFQAQSTNDFLIFAFQGLASFSAGLLLSSVGWQGVNFVALSLVMLCFFVWLYLNLQTYFIRLPSSLK